MVKKLQTKTYGQYAILLTAAMVLFSWAGCQILVLSGCFFNLRDSDEAQFFFAVGAALLLYSLYIKTRLKRHEISPWRESARAFYLAAIGALPLLTYAYYQFFLRRWMAAERTLATD